MPLVTDAVRAALTGGELRPERICVAYSGGLDSTLLLHILNDLATELSFRLRAAHVNHGLNPAADEWERRCVEVCRGLGVPLLISRVVVPAGKRSGGLEAAARQQRYAALASELADGEWLATAHHLDDQFETVLLHLLRGSGPAGLAGIPQHADLGAARLVRPLLTLTRAQLETCAMARGIGWVEDPMNADLRRDRNYLRRVVIPLLQARWPAVSDAVGRSAMLASEAATMLAETAAADAAELLRGSRIPVTQFSKLPEHRQRNLIRFVCAARGWAVPPERRLRTGLAQLRAATGERHPLLQWPGGEIRRYRDHLYLIDGGLPPMPPPPRAWAWDGAQPLSLAAGSGHVRLVAARGGLASSCLRAGPLTVRFRDGGESLRPVGDVHHRTLKFLFQQSGIVPWMRDRIPLLYQGDRLLAVADLWQAGDAVASGDAMGLQLVWEGHPEIR